MLKINTKKFDPANWPEGIWGTYAPGVRLKIRKLSADVFQSLRKPFIRMEMEVDKKSRRMIPVERTDDKADEEFENAMKTYLIEAFEGLGDENGNPLPDDLESRKSIMNNLPLNDWVWAFAQSQEVIAEQKHQEEIKNS
jgi:hypothetical protein